MIIPARYDELKMFGGDQFSLPLNWRDSNGDLFNLTGYHGRMKFFVDHYTDAPIITLTDPTVDGLGITLGSTSPNILPTIPNDQTVLTTFPKFYRLELQDLDGNWFRLLFGQMNYYP